MSGFNQLKKDAEEYTLVDVVIELKLFAGNVKSEIGYQDNEDPSKVTEGNINRRIREGFEEVNEKVDEIIKKQSVINKKIEKLDEERENKDKLKDRAVGAIIAILVGVMVVFFTQKLSDDTAKNRDRRDDIEYEIKHNNRNKR